MKEEMSLQIKSSDAMFRESVQFVAKDQRSYIGVYPSGIIKFHCSFGTYSNPNYFLYIVLYNS